MFVLTRPNTIISMKNLSWIRLFGKCNDTLTEKKDSVTRFSTTYVCSRVVSFLKKFTYSILCKML